ncbi:MAG: hypothetical protein ACPLOC_05975 [Candidatus Bathyarchaeales archaeon]
MDKKNLSKKLEDILGLINSPVAVKIIKSKRALAKYKVAKSKKQILPTVNARKEGANSDADSREHCLPSRESSISFRVAT